MNKESNRIFRKFDKEVFLSNKIIKIKKKKQIKVHMKKLSSFCIYYLINNNNTSHQTKSNHLKIIIINNILLKLEIINFIVVKKLFKCKIKELSSQMKKKYLCLKEIMEYNQFN